MKINFDNLPLKTSADNKTAYGITKTEQGAGRTQALRSGKMLTDISGIVMENAALKGQGMTADESAGDLLQTMVGLQKNYMSVMSDSMSGDDISRMMDEGFSPAEVDFEEAVTIVDKIKAELVKGGNYVPGYTDDVDLEALQEVAGSEASARQMQKALEENDVHVTKENLEDMSKAMVLFQGLKTPSEEAVSYLLRNDMEPTIEALHKAEFSGQKSGAAGNGYFAQAGVTVESAYYSHAEAQVDVEALAGSIEKVLTQAGFEATPQMLERAKAMIQEGIPLTGENLEKAEDIRSIDLKESSKDLFDQMAKAMASGKKAQETSLVAENSVYMQSAMIYEEVMSYGETVTDDLASQNKDITIRTLRRSAQRVEAADPTKNSDQIKTAEESPQILHARRVFQEVRLQMTVEANMKLLESGYSIETADLEDLVDALKLAEQQYETTLFGTPDSEKTALFAQTNSLRENIPQMAAAVLGQVQTGEVPFTLQSVKTSSDQFIATAAKAGEAYETMMTEVRSDLGDNIQKAFRNVDAILQDLQMEPTQLNEKAVRILGYNAMEVTEENITQIKALYLTVQDVYEKMTPAAALRMIRAGENPLDMDMQQLDQYLTGQQADPEETSQRYSSYLYQLEQHQEITQEERESYIGIYRFFKQLEKTDGAAIGAVMGAGENLSVRSLLKEMRSAKKGTMDYTVDDSFSGVEGINRTGTATIDAQIATAFQAQLLAGMPTLMEKKDVVAAGITEDDSLEEMAGKLLAAPEASHSREEIRAAREQMGQLSQGAIQAEEEILRELELPVNANNVTAAATLSDGGRALMKELYKEKPEEEASDLETLTEALTDEESAKAGYLEYTDRQKALVEDAMTGSDNLLDLHRLQNVYRQLTIAGRYSAQEEYHIPVEIEGEITSIHLSIRHEEGEAPRVQLKTQAEAYGELEISFTRTEAGYAAEMNQSNSSLEAKILEEFADIKDVEVFFGGIPAESEATGAEAETTTAELYKVAKTALTAIAKTTGGTHEDLL